MLLRKGASSVNLTKTPVGLDQFLPMNAGLWQVELVVANGICIYTLPETNMLPLKKNWKRRFLLKWCLFLGDMLVLGTVYCLINVIILGGI